MRDIAWNNHGDAIGVVMKRAGDDGRLTLRKLDEPAFDWLLSSESSQPLPNMPNMPDTPLSVSVEGVPTAASLARRRLQRFALFGVYHREAEVVALDVSSFSIRAGVDRGLLLEIDALGLGRVFVPATLFRAAIGLAR